MKEDPLSNQTTERISQLEDEIRLLGSELAVLRSQELVSALLEADGPLTRENRTVVRTERGLTIKGSRLTLYDIMASIKKEESLKNIRDIFELTDEEILDILDYIHLHKEEVEHEYQEVLKSMEENQRYWEEKNRLRLENMYQQRDVIRAKLQEWRKQYHAQDKQ
jgi:uncharacterized protein (DUF433 family)